MTIGNFIHLSHPASEATAHVGTHFREGDEPPTHHRVVSWYRMKTRAGGSGGLSLSSSTRVSNYLTPQQFVASSLHRCACKPQADNVNTSWSHAHFYRSVLFCSLAVLDPRVGHTMDVLSPFIPVLCHSD